MAMTVDQAGHAGRAFIEAHLKVIEAAYGGAVAAAYAGGMAGGARDYVLFNCGARPAFDLCYELADQIQTYQNERERQA